MRWYASLLVGAGSLLIAAIVAAIAALLPRNRRELDEVIADAHGRLERKRHLYLV